MQFNLADLFESFAAAFPDRLALVSGSTRLTYAQLNDRGTRLANYWRAHGIAPGDHVVFGFIPSCGRCPSCSTTTPGPRKASGCRA